MGTISTCSCICMLGATAKKSSKENHVSPLHICAAVGSPKIASILIDYDELLVRMRNSEQMIPLHKAAQYGRGSVAKILINRYKLLSKLFKAHSCISRCNSSGFFMLQKIPKMLNASHRVIMYINRWFAF